MKNARKLIYIIIVISIYSCDSGIHNQKVKEGSIQYDIEYLKKTNNKLVQALLPTSINFKFNSEYTKTSFRGSLGIYELSYIADNDLNLWSIVYSLKRNTYLYQQKLNEPKELINKIKIIKIIETNKYKKIANYNCKEIKIITNSEQNKETYLYYTDKIKFEFPILLNLFGKIDGVLMDFELPQGEMLLHIKAKEIINGNINKEEFIISEKAQKIKKNMMLDLLNTEF